GPAFAALALTSDSMIRQGMERAYYNRSIITDDRVAAYYRPVQTRGGQQAVILAKRQWDMLPIEQALGKVTQPALIIWGAEDQIIPLDLGKRMNSAIAGSRLIVFDKCGHAPQEEMPERLAGEVNSFITRITVTSSDDRNDVPQQAQAR